MPNCNAPRISAFFAARALARNCSKRPQSSAIEALAITDRNSLAGIVRAHEAAKVTGVHLIVGCRLDLTDGMSLLVYPIDRPAYARLCRLLSLGKKRGGKAQCRLDWSDVIAYCEGLIAVLVPDDADATRALHLRRLREAFGDRATLALTLRRRPNDALRLYELSKLAARAGVPTVVTNDVSSISQCGASCRMSSPASGTIAPSTKPGSGASVMPTAI
jgi:error-prone DNA polymerase